MISCDNLGPGPQESRNDHPMYSATVEVANDIKVSSSIQSTWPSQDSTLPVVPVDEASDKVSSERKPPETHDSPLSDPSPVDDVSSKQATLEDHNLATAMSTTQESISTDELHTISSLASKYKTPQCKEPPGDSSSKNVKSSEEEPVGVNDKAAQVPEMWQKMSDQIRSAVAKSMLSTDVVKRKPVCIKLEKDGLGVEAAPTEYMIEITDELREFTEVKMNQGQLTHNKKVISMDVLLNKVMEYNRQNPSTPLNIAPALQRSYIVGKSQQYPELIAEALRPVERIRLSSMERTYQNMIARSTPVFKKLQKADSHNDEVPETLMIELKSSLAMALSLLFGLFISFAIGWFGGPFIGLRSTLSRAILGLVLTVVCMFTEMALIILRSSKLDRMRSMRKRRQQRHLEQARIKLHKSPTPSTEATNYSVPSVPTIHEDLSKED